MNREKIVYCLLITSFIIFISVFISTFIIKNLNIKGNVTIEKKYYDIVYNTNDNKYLSLNKDNVCVRLDKIVDELYYDIYNVGNKDTSINNINIILINTSLDKNKLNIKLDVNNGDIIKGGSIKRVLINIDYDGEIKENDYLNFDINTSFN